MKILFNVFVISVLILGLISSPFSFAQTSEGSENIAIELEESISITSNDNDIEDTETNSDNSNLGQEVSNFVHEARKLFEQQKTETKEIIAQCREDMRNAEPSERKSVREECKSNLEEIRESYKTLRETYRETFKEFRENMMVFIQESKGLPIDSTERDAAIANIEFLSDSSEKRELLRELQQKMNEQIREDSQKLREQEKREREIIREELKAEREALQDEREALRGAGIESSDDEFKDEQELEIEVEVEQGIAQIIVESNGEEFEFQMDWIDEQSVVAEIASRTGLTASQIEEVIEFEIELEGESEEGESEDDDDHEDGNEVDDVDSEES